ncbi:centromere protein O isoform X2 [Myotis yumanensis]|uniref:centromere protein O isoform X2 n=1 Tax=Myotis yumanensis TaxID=159337 RepID=UPI0038D3EC1D
MELADNSSPEGGSGAGVLAHLERLEAESRKKFEEPQGAESALGNKIRNLRSLRDKLRAEVNRRRAEVEASVEPDQTFEVSEQEVLERKRENVKSILQAYRFTGLSGKLTSRGVCVSISTAFEGNLLDSYFVDLVIQKPLRIHHHSIPVFIPLEEIAAKYLQSNIQHFLYSLCEYLNAYSGRKYQADRLQRSQMASPSHFVLDCYIRTSQEPFQLTSLLLIKERMHCPPPGKNSELPMKTCSVQSPFIKCLLHLQEEKKSWI